MKNQVFVTLLSLVGCLQVISAARDVVIDLSHFNGNVDMKKVKEDGIELVIHKCTQGTGYVDTKYKTNKLAAEKAGLQWAAYHFADGTDGKTQAAHFLKNTGSVKFYAVDFENNPQGLTVGKKQAEDIVEAIKKSTGKCPIIYGAQAFLDGLNSKVLAQCPLWVASYRPTSTPNMPKLWSSWYMWQYTAGSTGSGSHSVNGVDGKVDRSYINN